MGADILQTDYVGCCNATQQKSSVWVGIKIQPHGCCLRLRDSPFIGEVGRRWGKKCFWDKCDFKKAGVLRLLEGLNHYKKLGEMD